MNGLKKHGEIVATAVVVAVLLTLLRDSSGDKTMSMAASGVMVGGLVLSVVVISLHILDSKVRDERESSILTLSNSSAYVLGLALLTVQIAVQSFQHSLEFWAPFILSAMIVTKLLVGYSQRKK